MKISVIGTGDDDGRNLCQSSQVRAHVLEYYAIGRR